MKNNLYKKYFSNQTLRRKKTSGYILIEALVAITLLLVGLPAALSSASKGISSASYAKDQLIATNLAQEGIEIIRTTRDGNYLLNRSGTVTNWLAGFGPAICGSGRGCIVDIGPGASDPMIQACGAGCVAVLNVDANGIYSHSAGGTPTKYRRTVKVVTVCSGSGCPEEVMVTSTVNFITSSGGPKSVSVTEDIYNWLQ